MKHKIIVEDWKETDSVIDQLLEAIEHVGGHIYKIPSYVGTDTYGWIISKKKLTKKQVKKINKKL